MNAFADIVLNLDELIQFRKDLHQNPELSRNEINTQKKIYDFISRFDPDEIITNIGGYGLAAIYNGNAPGPTLAFRADIDALPIQEKNHFPHASKIKNVSHKCGHDGHTTMVAGLGKILQDKKPEKGRVVLIFQPAEETLDGAKKFVEDPKFKKIKPDYLFGIHNFQSEEENQILLRSGQMSPAVTTMLVDLEGTAAHASRPESGVCPYNAAIKIVAGAYELQNNKDIYSDDFSMVTIVNFILGKNPGYGTAPADAHIAMTLRAYKDDVLSGLTGQIENYIIKTSKLENLLNWKISYTDETISCTNDEQCCQIVEKAAKENNLDVQYMDVPMRGGEDVGYIINTCSKGGAFFLLGSGRDQPDLHAPDFDFPDRLIESGIKIYNSIITQILN
ncbi:MAG: amidohydrolase [Desulfobacula sp.]|uniref:amidohydrolase n=1 Tax=Desulfobacula sp. TaxID=2593537 RepID=UPI0025B9958C|nr:amidohydrolase [Desulfobacula sp.]MCD4721306.1 amidohydrolase [Desulfobacula sp.]